MDLISILNLCLGVSAIVLSGAALLVTRRDRRADALVKVEEYLLSEPLQRGMQRIFEAERKGMLPVDDEEFSHIMRAFAAMNAVAEWSRQGLVDRKVIVEEWHHQLRQMRTVYESVLAVRSAWHE
jgi:hypothetical protein